VRTTAILIVLLSALGFSSTAYAIDLKPCQAITDIVERAKCLEDNLIALNAAFETVTKELRADASSAIKQGDGVSLLSTGIGNCAALLDRNNTPLTGSPCGTDNDHWDVWTISRRTAGAAGAPPVAPVGPGPGKPPGEQCPGGPGSDCK
jgi:hypothetical protein